MESVKKMSAEEKRFSFLSSGFIYKKERNSSDSLIKKFGRAVKNNIELKTSQFIQ